jgi:hypothetical protein
MRAIVLVEGQSDRVALETLAARRGRDLPSEGVAIVAIGGAQAVGRAVAELPAGVAPVGLCDVAEARHFRRALGESAYYVCDADLEDELIRCLGAETVESIVEAHGDLRRLRTMQNQPEWRGRPLDQQLRRVMGSGGSRKVRYARLLVEALDLDAVPPPLDGVLAHVA